MVRLHNIPICNSIHRGTRFKRISDNKSLHDRAFSKLKHWMRHAGTRTRDTLWQAVGNVLDRVSPEECSNYFQNAGYASVKT